MAEAAERVPARERSTESGKPEHGLSRFATIDPVNVKITGPGSRDPERIAELTPQASENMTGQHVVSKELAGRGYPL